jgi:site-specific DNA-methyltransferase (adenine-specific)
MTMDDRNGVAISARGSEAHESGGLISAQRKKERTKKQIDPLADFRNQFLCGNTVDIMRTLPAGSIDLVVTSPPYNLKNSTGNGMKDGRGGKWKNARLVNGYSNYNDCMPHDDYVAWQRECLTEMMRVLKDDGAIFYNHKWRVQAGMLQDRHDI